MNSFRELNLPEPISRAVSSMGYSIPTPIQAQAIPAALSQRDLIACAETGTGKTAAFCIPLLARILSHEQKARDPVALILVPTRELAQQIELYWKSLARFVPRARCAMLIGGVSMHSQFNLLRQSPMVIVATPGRLIDHLNRRSLNLSHVHSLVLDEADRMLDMGFAPQLKQVLRFLPNGRQSLLYSATWTEEVNRLSAQYLKNPARVSVGTTSRAVQKIEQTSIATTTKQKNETLLDEINQSEGPVLVFARTKARTDRVAKYLNSYGLQVNRLHGGRSQGQRKSALQNFRAGRTRILVATDIAARGIDVTGISHVINYDLPQVAEDYIHRIGRTARAGASGNAVSFVTPEDRAQWQVILKLLRRTGSRVPEPRPAALANRNCN